MAWLIEYYNDQRLSCNPGSSEGLFTLWEPYVVPLTALYEYISRQSIAALEEQLARNDGQGNLHSLLLATSVPRNYYACRGFLTLFSVITLSGVLNLLMQFLAALEKQLARNDGQGNLRSHYVLVVVEGNLLTGDLYTLLRTSSRY